MYLQSIEDDIYYTSYNHNYNELMIKDCVNNNEEKIYKI